MISYCKRKMEDSKLLKERTSKALSFVKEKWTYLSYILLALIVFLAVKIRSSNLPGLRDISTGAWTLGPDLDPWLFTRWAETIVSQGSLPALDIFRYVPLGFSTKQELLLHPYMIAWFHSLASLFGSESVVQSAAIFPVFMFALTVLAFFFLAREFFKSSLGKKTASLIALLSAFFLSVLPALLPRTIAGIPEKESSGFFFLFLALYLFLLSWTSHSNKKAIILSVLAGLATAGMALVWGGYIFIHFTIAISVLLAFIFKKLDKQKIIYYATWFISSGLVMIISSQRHTLSGLISGTATGAALFVLLILVVDYLVYETKFSNLSTLKKLKSKMPRQLFSIILTLILALILSSLILSPSFALDKIERVTNTLVTPTTDRLGTTVAENRQPFFTEWANNFGPQISGIPLMFWLFFAGSIFLFYNLLSSFGKKERSCLTIAFAFFMFATIFSRYSSSSLLNGTNSFSLLVYSLGFFILFFSLGFWGSKSKGKIKSYNYSGLLALLGLILMAYSSIVIIPILLILPFLYLCFEGIISDQNYRKINFSLIVIFSLTFLSIVGTRGAVRLIMIFIPSVSILVSYLAVSSVLKTKNMASSNKKTICIILTALILIATAFSALYHYQGVSATAKNYVPSSYNQQWQLAMSWVRENTAPASVFAHWWDYGYWVQSIGDRPTVLDGGNSLPYWNYLMGRHVLTASDAPDQVKETASFLYSHEVDSLLIDSTDIGKYSAYSFIGSDENFDRRSYIPTMLRDNSATIETKNFTRYAFIGSSGLDQDIIIEQGGETIFLPSGRAALVGIVLEKSEKETKRPTAVFAYQGQQYQLPLRYMSRGSGLIDFGSGFNAGIFLMPSISSSGASIEEDSALYYLSPRVVDSNLAKLFLFNEPSSLFSIAHTEDSPVIKQIKSQAPDFPREFVYYPGVGVQGPIKIWSVNYPANTEINETYLQTNFPDEALTRA